MSEILTDIETQEEMDIPNQSGALVLRPFQEEAIKSIRDALLKAKQLILIQLATGTGRSMIIQQLLNSYPFVERPTTLLVRTTEERLQLQSLLNYPDENTPFSSKVNIEISDTFKLDKTTDRYSKTNKLLITIGFALNGKEYALDDENSQLFDQFPNIISIISTEPSKEDIGYYGQPVFKYSINDATKDGVLVPIIGHLCETVSNLTALSNEAIAEIIHPFLDPFFNTKGRKAVVLCSSYNAVDKVRIALDHLYPHVTIISSKESASITREKINAFSKHGESFIAISTSSFFHGIEIPTLTDLVLCKKFKSQAAFLQAIARVTRPSPEKMVSHVWDFGGNKRFLTDIATQIEEGNLRPDRYETTTELQPDIASNESSAKIHTQRLILPVGDNVSDIDMLGRGRLLHVLQGLIRDTEKRNFRPFVIGIFGKWGAGKSTVVNLLQNKIKDDNQFMFLPFNAWQSEHCTNMVAALAHKLVEQLYKQKNVFKRIFYSLFYNLLLEKDKIGVFILLFGVIAIAVAFTINTEDTFKLIKIDTTVYSIDKKGFITFLIGFVALIGKGITSYLKQPFSAKINKIINKPNYSAHLGTAEQVKQEIAAVIKARSFLRSDMWKYIKTLPWETFRDDFQPEANRQFIVIM